MSRRLAAGAEGEGDVERSAKQPRGTVGRAAGVLCAQCERRGQADARRLGRCQGAVDARARSGDV